MSTIPGGIILSLVHDDVKDALDIRFTHRRSAVNRRGIEAAFVHVISNRVETAYARSDLFERQRFMDDCVDYLAAAPRPSV